MVNFQDDLYRDIIMDHFKNPRHKGKLTDCDIEVSGANPFCGDEIELTLKMQGETVHAVGVEAKGCAISRASASMMAGVLAGRALPTLKEWIAFLKSKLIDSNQSGWPEELSELEAIEGVKQYPVRIKCAMLPWNTLIEGLKEYKEKGFSKVALKHVEGEAETNHDDA